MTDARRTTDGASAATTREQALEAWHARYDAAVREGRNLPDAVVVADTTPEMLAEAKREREQRDSICVLIPKEMPVARAYEPYEPFAPPGVTAYDEVWITPHELRRVAVRKLNGETL